MSEATPKAKRIAVFGAGAVGSLVAARLVQAGQNPTLIARSKRLVSLQKNGLQLSEGDAQASTLPIRALAARDAGRQDVVMIALKAQDIPAALPDLTHLIGPETVIVPMVNGIPWWYFQPQQQRPVRAVDPDGALTNAFDPLRIVGAVLFLTSTMQADGTVQSLGMERITLGPIADLPRHESEALLAPLRTAFAGCRIAASFSESIRRDLWAKIALNLATNPLSVVGHATLAEQFHDPALRLMVVAVLEETIALARALGVEPRLSLTQMLDVGGKAGPFYTSMAQDYERGTRLEMGAIALSVLELAQDQNIPMPTARMMADLCAFRASKRRVA